MAKSNYLEAKILDHVLRNTSYTSPTTVYAALMTAAPTDAGGGTEVTGGSYARQAITFAAASGGSIANSAAVNFTGLPAATITHIAVYDASTTGNLLYYGALTSTIISVSGSELDFATGNFIITEE